MHHSPEVVLMHWKVAVDFISPAWHLFGRVFVVEAATEQEARRAALRRAWERTGEWVTEHHDYCPGPLRYRVVDISADQHTEARKARQPAKHGV
jgi:hypothetical protein